MIPWGGVRVSISFMSEEVDILLKNSEYLITQILDTVPYSILPGISSSLKLQDEEYEYVSNGNAQVWMQHNIAEI